MYNFVGPETTGVGVCVGVGIGVAVAAGVEMADGAT
jgi:hypothetical protein